MKFTGTVLSLMALLLLLLLSSTGLQAQQMGSGWHWPTGTGDFGGYAGFWYYWDGRGWHLAQDMKRDQGQAVYSIGDGEVVKSQDIGGYGPGGTAGGAVLIRYQAGDGTWFTALYGHLDNRRGIGPIAAGEIVGVCNAYSPSHLHFGIHPGYDVAGEWYKGWTPSSANNYGFTDPIPFLNAHPPDDWEPGEYWNHTFCQAIVNCYHYPYNTPGMPSTPAGYLGKAATMVDTSTPSQWGTTGDGQFFEHGIIHHSKYGAFEIVCDFFNAYNSPSSGGSGGVLGFPTSHLRPAKSSPYGTTGMVQKFEGGYLQQTASRLLATFGAVAPVYAQAGESGGWLGFPTSIMLAPGSRFKNADSDRWRQDFECGYIAWSKVNEKYEALPYFLRVEGDARVFLVDYGVRRWIPDDLTRKAIAWFRGTSSATVKVVDPSQAPPLGKTVNHLVKVPVGTGIYYVPRDCTKLRYIETEASFSAWGFTWGEVMELSPDWVKARYQAGRVLPATPPKITVLSYPQHVSAGQSIPVRWKLADWPGEVDTELHYRTAGGSATQTATQHGGNKEYTASVPAGAVVNGQSIEMWIRAAETGKSTSTDDDRLEFYSPDVAAGFAPLVVNMESPSAPTITKSFPAGTWMIGLPAAPVSPDAQTVLGTNQVARWDASTQAYRYYANGAFNLGCGTGCWVNYPSGHSVSFQGHTNAAPVSCPLKAKWNLLANPYSHDLPWSQITATSSIQPFGWCQNASGTGYQLVCNLAGLNTVTAIKPWHGFWVYANADGQAALGTVSTSAATPVPEQSVVDWVIRLSARVGQAVDEHKYVGVTKIGSPLLATNPPPLGSGYVSVYSAGTDEERYAINLQAAGGKHTWDLVVETDVANSEVTLTFPDLSPVPNDLALLLTDLDTGRAVNMRATGSYRFTSGSGITLRHLRIEARPRTQQAPLIMVVSAQTVIGGLQVAYSTSAPAEIEIGIHNLAGRRIAALPVGYQTSGLHTTTWTGRNTSGSKVPPGPYLLALHAIGDDGTRSTRVVTCTVK